MKEHRQQSVPESRELAGGSVGIPASCAPPAAEGRVRTGRPTWWGSSGVLSLRAPQAVVDPRLQDRQTLKQAWERRDRTHTGETCRWDEPLKSGPRRIFASPGPSSHEHWPRRQGSPRRANSLGYRRGRNLGMATTVDAEAGVRGMRFILQNSGGACLHPTFRVLPPRSRACRQAEVGLQHRNWGLDVRSFKPRGAVGLRAPSPRRARDNANRGPVQLALILKRKSPSPEGAKIRCTETPEDAAAMRRRRRNASRLCRAGAD